MAEEIGALRVALAAATATFERDMKGARDALQSNTRSMERALYSLRDSFNNSMKSALSLRGVFSQLFAGASVAGLVYFVKSSIDAADRMNDLSKSTGVSVETLSTMGYAAKQSGLDLESLANGFKRLDKNMSEAASGSGDAKDAFSLLGISVKDGEGKLKSAEQIMLELADKFAGMEDGAGKTALAMKFFGKSGADLIPMLNEGAAGLARLQQEARDAGIALTTEAAEAADRFNDNLSKLAANITGTVKPAIGWLVDAMNRVFDLPDTEKLYVAEKRLGFLREELEKLQSVDPKKFDWWRSFLSKPQSIAKELEAAKKAVEDQAKIVAELQAKVSPPPAPPKLPPPVPPDEAAKKEAERLKAAIDKQIDSLIEQGATFGMTAAEAQDYKLAIQGATTEQRILARDLLIANEAQKKSNDEWEKSKELVKAQAAEGKRLFEGMRTPMEAVTAEFEKLNGLYEQGAISAETFTRAAQKAVDDYGEKIKKTTEEGKDRFADLKNAIEGWGRASADTFADFVMTGKSSFSDLANSIIKDMIRMMAYKMIFEPMFSGISNHFFPAKTATSGGAPVTADGPTVLSAHGNAFNKGRVIPFAKGGVINRPMTFPLGLAGEAGPEAILPLTRIGGDLGVKADMGGMSGAPMKIEIINKSGQPMEVTDAKFNFQDAVISVWVDAYERNKGGLRSRMGG